ncbi:DUF6934 family protein [Chitinophaga qingshengii]|uniref:Uncharacterized protein n=1 Tax=Chitinophaga qingshengii TaxID=1569794 RepID=A0ABR7TRG0_9BACT|nr:hypothetical protein [Chitinophaga qingshengii]MBC9931569.1 hypothetical protein [Chitinophaga qingshengii]
MSSTDFYDIKIDTDINTDIGNNAQKVKFYFESVGTQKVIKAIEYSYLDYYFLDKPVYNLGFGNYNPITEEICDIGVSNNGDVYKVFNTVLHTVSIFFNHIPNGLLFVQGSDSSPDYLENCILTCHKNCIDKCKKVDRRISIYQGFIDKNYSLLFDKYVFMGGVAAVNGKTRVENYVVGKRYNAVLVYKII